MEMDIEQVQLDSKGRQVQFHSQEFTAGRFPHSVCHGRRFMKTLDGSIPRLLQADIPQPLHPPLNQLLLVGRQSFGHSNHQTQPKARKCSKFWTTKAQSYVW